MRIEGRPATASSLTTTGTLGVILGFGTDIGLEKLAEHCLEFNEKYESTHRPDLIVVLDVGVINYTAEFIGMRKTGDLATTTGEDTPSRPVLSTLSPAPTAPTPSTGYLPTSSRTWRSILADRASRPSP